VLYFGVRVITLPEAGQVARYITPMYPALAVIVAAGLGRVERVLSRPRLAAGVAMAVIACWGVWTDYDFARDGYAVHVRNMDDGAVAPAFWIREHTPAGSRVAFEQAGAVGLYADRPTLDIVGLTTPDMLGHFRDWEYTKQYLRLRGASYLLFFPAWFPGQHTPDWVRPVMNFPIPDNQIAGSDPIVLYAVN
jgi:hypothetical protein